MGSEAPMAISFRTSPERYHHWKLSVQGEVATLILDVQETAGLVPGYELKLNSYDLGVDIELADAVNRLRFEHPCVAVVVVTSGKARVFCAGANIRMLAQSTHNHKVNFCKFTNETRLAIEDASGHSGQRYLAAINATASGGGYELALACDHILLVEDGSSAVSLPEVPLLGVLPGTGGLTRLVDKRLVRRDHADVFATRAEGMRGRTAVAWRLVDEVAPRSRFDAAVQQRAEAMAADSDRPRDSAVRGVPLTPIASIIDGSEIRYSSVSATLHRGNRAVHITIHGPQTEVPADAATAAEQGADFWPLRWAREFDDLMLHLRFNEPELGTWVLYTEGDPARVAAYDNLLAADGDDWFLREVTLHMKRTLKRLDLSARSIIALIEQDSCFTGCLAELAFAADRSYHLDTELGPTLTLTPLNFGLLPMSNGISRLASRFLANPTVLGVLEHDIGDTYGAAAAEELGLITFAPDDIDWADDVRLAIEERAAISSDALTGMEANHRFVGPETFETKIFCRLTAWQNWIFLRPNASGPDGALRRYGSGQRPVYDPTRI